LAIIVLAVVWLQKQPGAAEGDRVAMGKSGNGYRPDPGGSANPATWAAEWLLWPNSPRRMHNCEKKSKFKTSSRG
jgi:hypothetical protein